MEDLARQLSRNLLTLAAKTLAKCIAKSLHGNDDAPIVRLSKANVAIEEEVNWFRDEIIKWTFTYLEDGVE